MAEERDTLFPPVDAYATRRRTVYAEATQVPSQVALSSLKRKPLHTHGCNYTNETSLVMMMDARRALMIRSGVMSLVKEP